MSDSARVLSIQALKDFKVALVKFAEEAGNALSGVDMEIRRMRDWLERDQLSYWKGQVKKRQEIMMQAKADLFRRQLSQQGSEAKSDSEQKEALREAQRRLRVAEEKVEVVKKLIPFFDRAVSEYLPHSRPLGDHLAGGLETSMARLETMIVTLEQYLAISPPSAPRVGNSEGSSSRGGVKASARSGTASNGTEYGEEGPTEAEQAATPGAEPEAEATPAPTFGNGNPGIIR